MGSCGSKPGGAGSLGSNGSPGSAVPMEPALAKKIDAVRTSANALTSPQKGIRASASSSVGEVGGWTKKSGWAGGRVRAEEVQHRPVLSQAFSIGETKGSRVIRGARVRLNTTPRVQAPLFDVP